MGDFNISQWVGHTLGGSTLLATIVGWFPPIAAFVAFIWYVLQIYEGKTCQNYLRDRRDRRIERLKRKLVELEQKKRDDRHRFGAKGEGE